MERAVGHHRGHHRAHPRVGVGLSDCLQPLRGRGRKLEAQVVGGGASLADHLHRPDEGGEVLVLEGAPAGDPGGGVEQQLERPAVADALGEVVVAVGMRVDEARHEQAARCVERGGVGGRGHSRQPDLAHRVVRNQDVGGFCRVACDVEQASAPDDRVHDCPLDCGRWIAAVSPSPRFPRVCTGPRPPPRLERTCTGPRSSSATIESTPWRFNPVRAVRWSWRVAHSRSVVSRRSCWRVPAPSRPRRTSRSIRASRSSSPPIRRRAFRTRASERC